jgi:hypothetical protein
MYQQAGSETGAERASEEASMELLGVINLWDPAGAFTIGGAIVLAFLLGMVHGITPDEHTWPITFSYAIGSYSTRRGIVAGLTFSLAFTLQRAIASELANLALAKVLVDTPWLDYAVYVVVGLAMALAARYLFRGKHWHLLAPAHHIDGELPELTMKPWMPAVHGFIAGWGVGAFALILYTVLSPAMPTWLGWVPGAAFGIGTTVVQALAGGLFGAIARHLSLSEAQIRSVALVTAGRTLLWGGAVFVVAGLLGLAFPSALSFHLTTPLHVHNLHNLGIAQVLVIFTVVIMGMGTLVVETRHQALRSRRSAAAGEVRPEHVDG